MKAIFVEFIGNTAVEFQVNILLQDTVAGKNLFYTSLSTTFLLICYCRVTNVKQRQKKKKNRDKMKTNLWLTFKKEQLCIGHKILSTLTLSIKFDFQATASTMNLELTLTIVICNVTITKRILFVILHALGKHLNKHINSFS